MFHTGRSVRMTQIHANCDYAVQVIKSYSEEHALKIKRSKYLCTALCHTNSIEYDNKNEASSVTRT